MKIRQCPRVRAWRLSSVDGSERLLGQCMGEQSILRGVPVVSWHSTGARGVANGETSLRIDLTVGRCYGWLGEKLVTNCFKIRENSPKSTGRLLGLHPLLFQMDSKRSGNNISCASPRPSFGCRGPGGFRCSRYGGGENIAAANRPVTRWFHGHSLSDELGKRTSRTAAEAEAELLRVTVGGLVLRPQHMDSPESSGYPELKEFRNGQESQRWDLNPLSRKGRAGSIPALRTSAQNLSRKRILTPDCWLLNPTRTDSRHGKA